MVLLNTYRLEFKPGRKLIAHQKAENAVFSWSIMCEGGTWWNRMNHIPSKEKCENSSEIFSSSSMKDCDCEWCNFHLILCPRLCVLISHLSQICQDSNRNITTNGIEKKKLAFKYVIWERLLTWLWCHHPRYVWHPRPAQSLWLIIYLFSTKNWNLRAGPWDDCIILLIDIILASELRPCLVFSRSLSRMTTLQQSQAKINHENTKFSSAEV